ncbi:SpoIIE family protein phosphatase [Streptomyces sp. NBC_01230]|uniref:PP2C family protein-serine/threonine phosphatase n=1 Tax=Streptomyces sp. NBC_01230 TaxID=2903784 RepID=UPI002E0F21C3|nr:SpoIIE family protein phosphatase [Streptomyces sp. NBC_01230]
MTTPRIDYQALFAATPSPYLVLGPDLVIIDVNRAYLTATGRTRDELVGQYIFDAFPDNPADPGADGVQNLGTSLRRALRSKEPDTMAVQRYDIPVADKPGVFEERWDVTAFVLSHPSRPRAGGDLGKWEAMESELYARARELQGLNEELRLAHARERQVAVTLQEAMLYSPDLARHRDVAVRYLPAAGSLNVCGDWYDLVDLPDSGCALAVGDVVGHGLEAAAVMGMLRSALSAAVRSRHEPAKALEVLGLYARSVEGALATTAVQVVIAPRSHRITYSSAGHLPPVLVHHDGTFDLLDRATDPPLGARPKPVPRPQAELSYTPGDTLVLYSDGLIERRGEDIDAGLHRLTDALARFTSLSPQRLADAVLARLGVSAGARDDIVLVVLRL